MNNSEFIEKCDELTVKLNKLEVSRNVSLEQIKIQTGELKELISQLENIDVPIVNGEKVMTLSIDSTKLGSYQYIHDLNMKLPLILEKLESTGMELIEKVSL